MDFFMTYVYRVLCGLPEPHSREMQAMTDERVRVCLNYAKMSSPILMQLHKSLTVEQLNSIPLHSRCCSTGKQLTKGSGVQLILDDMHVCVDMCTLKEWFHYFRLRNFPLYMCGLIREWAIKQPWYIESAEFDQNRLIASHWVQTYKELYNESLQYLMTCCKKF